jgi:para-nitrobenzyl esterase
MIRTWPLALASLIVLVPVSSPCPADTAPQSPVVSTDRGPVQGIRRSDGVTAFLGIPYATAARWRPPVDVARGEGARDATRPGPACAQDTRRVNETAELGIAEQCQSVNVYTRDPRARSKLPVMVWIHGGSFRWGTGASSAFDGKPFVDAGVVLVTINYRLGRFGRFAHPALSRAQANEPLGNYGLMDQIAALKWVRRNISAFGGDADKVTIFGCSAGGVSVLDLMATPDSKGLFAGAIAQSGGVAEVNAMHLNQDRPFAPSLEADGLRMAKHFKIADDESAVERLRALPMQDVIAYDGAEPGFSMNPAVDGQVLPDDLGVIFDQGRQHPVPLVAGSSDWEDSLLGRAVLTSDFILAPVKPDIENFRQAYDGASDDVLSRGWFRDGVFIAPSRLLADRMSRVGKPGYVYLMTYVAEQARATLPGAPHCSEIPYVFQNYAERRVGDTVQDFSARDRGFGEVISQAWIQFAKTGQPRSTGLPSWPAFRFDASDRMMEFGATPRLLEGYRPKVMDYYRQRTEHMLRAKSPPAAGAPPHPAER